MILDYLELSYGSLKHRKLRSWLTMLGIFIGIAAVVSLISLGEGLRVAINSQFGFLGSDLIRVNVGSLAGPPGFSEVENPLTKTNVEQIKRIQGVKMSSGRIVDSGKMEYNNKVAFITATSMPDGDERRDIEELVNYETEEGRLLKDRDKYSVVIGSGLADEEKFGKEVLSDTNVKVEAKEFRVIGILKKKGDFVVDSSILLNEEIQREIFDKEKEVYDMIVVRVVKGEDIEKVKLDIEKLLRKERDVKEGEEDFSVITAQSVAENLNNILLSINIFVWIIASISLVVGGIGIMNTMYTSVLERTKEIGIMKSIGAKNATIFILFFIESGLLGSVGGIVGILLGVFFATGLSSIGRAVLGTDLIAAHFSVFLILGALLFSFILGSLFGVLPAYRASKLSPVDSMRYVK